MTPIFQINHSLRIKINEPGAWILETEKSDYLLEDGRYSLFLLPLLEHDYSRFIASLNENFLSKSINKFPMRPLLIYPFNLKMEYWADLSLNWIIQTSLVTDLKPWANEQNTGWMSQKLRHRFFKVFSLKSYPNKLP